MIRFFINALSKGLSFSQSESKGVLVLILLVILVLTVPRFVIKELKRSNEEVPFNAGELKTWVATVQTSYTEKKETNPIGTTKPHQVYREERSFDPPTTNEIEKATLPTYDINKASLDQLQEIRGIGPAYSKRISKYRELLGGFASMDQLQEVYGLDSLILREVNRRFVIRSEVSPIPINSDSAKVLAAHPYISYDLAWIIINYRKQNGDIENSEDLKAIKAIDDSLYQKLKPYID